MSKGIYNKYLRINKSKLWFSYKLLSFFMLAIGIIILAFGVFLNPASKIKILTQITLVTILAFPPLLFLLILLISLIKLNFKQRVLNIIDHLDKNSSITVSNSLIFEDTKWFFTDFSKTIAINNKKIKCFVHDMDMKHINFVLDVSINDYSKKQKLLNQQNQLEKENISISPYFDHITKAYKIKTFKKFDSHKVEVELLSFINKIETKYL